jgi:hypothetical protein
MSASRPFRRSWLTVLFRRASAAAVAAVVVGVTASCTMSDDNAGASSPPTGSASASSPSGGSEAAADEAEADRETLPLPLPPEDISDWAASALPGPVTAGRAVSQSGWLSAGTSPQLTVSGPEEPPGRYAVDVACLGGGTITVRLQEPEDPAAPDSPDATCSDETISFEYDSSPDAPRVILGLSGDPTAYALAIAPVAG